LETGLLVAYVTLFMGEITGLKGSKTRRQKVSFMTIRKEHWENIYRTKDHKKVSWHQEHPEISLQLLSRINAQPGQSVIDVGCGVSLLVDNLIERGFKDIALVDLSSQALSAVKSRLGANGDIPDYYHRDISRAEFNRSYDIWHDRAVFHFLINAEDRENYMTNLAKTLSEDGRAIIGTFSLNGPNACSGLDVVQYDEDKMEAELKGDLELEYAIIDIHVMPSGAEQEFMYFIIKHNKSH
jgi:2-polyprenyl-3-methyl-5-hydroxy-6-metoxy-1,4-benzoquinol methylase